MEFTTEELFEAIDKNVRELLDRNTVEEPPVDALALVQSAFGFRVEYVEEEEEPEMESAASRYARLRGNPSQRKPGRRELLLRPTMGVEAQNNSAAKAIARELIPTIMTQLGVVPGTEQKSAQNQLVNLMLPRLLLPMRMFASEARKKNNDLARLKEVFTTATWEMIALRLLELEDLCVIAVVDDGVVGLRRSNGMQVTKKLTEAELQCIEKVKDSEEPQTVRREGWTSRGWLIPTGPYQRIILRSVPDEL